MRFAALTLVTTDKPDPERDALAAAWEAEGGSVVRIGRFWDPPEVDADTVRLYGGSSFCLVLAQIWNLDLLSPDDLLLTSLPEECLKRRIEARTLADAGVLTYPCFVKAAVPKLFTALVFESASDLRKECDGLEESTAILVSEIVDFVAEARSFVLNGEILTTSVYEGEGSEAEATEFVARVLSGAEGLPHTLVLDSGLIPGKGWALVEANASWGAGLNGCDPMQAARCIAKATSRHD